MAEPIEYKEELLPCPFCGGTVRVIKNSIVTNCSKPSYIFDCNECSGYVSFLADSKNEAIEQWNRRVDK